MSEENKSGFNMAADMLSRLSISERERILGIIAEKEPLLVEKLRNSLYSFEDLIYLTPKMLVELLREIDLGKLGLALRGASKELRDFILKNVSSSIAEEINEVLEGPLRPVSEVQQSMSKIMEVVIKKIEKGELVLNKGSSDQIID